MFRILALVAILSSTAVADNPSIFMVGDVENTYTGTAFALQTKRGIVTVTNAHVCQQRKALLAAINGKLKLIVVISVYSDHDLCILSAVPGIPALKMGTTYLQGEYVYTEGFPLHKHRVTVGRVGRYFKISKDMIEVEYLGEVDSGASGSPVQNSKGEVIGVINIKYGSPGKWLGGMVPLEFLKYFVEYY